MAKKKVKFKLSGTYVRKRNAATRIQKAYRKKKSTAAKVKKLTKEVYKNQQKGFKDHVMTQIGVGTTGSVTEPFMLSAIQLGTSNVGERLGNVITVKNLRATINCEVATSDVSNILRILLVRMPESTSHVPLIGDILEQGNAISFYKKNPDRKYDILYDRRLQLQNNRTPLSDPNFPGTSQAYSGVYRPSNVLLDINIPFKNGLELRYDAGGVLVKNNVYLVMVSDSYYGGLIGTHPMVNGIFRATYIM